MNQQSSTVFYVDDNPRARDLLGGVLRDSGFNVITASNPLEAVGLCKEVLFDLALLDYEMQYLASSHLVQEIHSLEPRVPVVMISGRASYPPVEWCLADAHFGRGTSVDDLLETMWLLAGSKPDKAITRRSAAAWSDST
jgi:CheY-like chemotaxis protein